jgi:hypothetical protein
MGQQREATAAASKAAKEAKQVSKLVG